jgi:hypothetical protein
MLFSAVDDRSGVVYDEYRCVVRPESPKPVTPGRWRRKA